MNAKQLSQGHFLQNKYLSVYWAIIDRALTRNPTGLITELHHILPKGSYMFPQYKSLKDHPWNGVRLTLREHFICHLLMTRFTFGKQRSSAVYGLMRFSSSGNKCTSRQYDIAKSLFREVRKVSKNPNKGKPGRAWTDEDKAKGRVRMKAAMNTTTAKENCAKAKRGKPGKPHTSESAAKIGFAQRNLSTEQRKNKANAKMGEKNPMFGLKCYNNGAENIFVFPGEEPVGWMKGRLFKRKP